MQHRRGIKNNRKGGAAARRIGEDEPAVVEPDDLMDAAYDMAKDIVVNAPLAVKYARECIQKSQCADLRSGIEFENAMFGLCFATPDQKEGMQAFLEKRKANFQNHL